LFFWFFSLWDEYVTSVAYVLGAPPTTTRSYLRFIFTLPRHGSPPHRFRFHGELVCMYCARRLYIYIYVYIIYFFHFYFRTNRLAYARTPAIRSARPKVSRFGRRNNYRLIARAYIILWYYIIPTSVVVVTLWYRYNIYGR